MALRIQTNVASINAQRQLNKSTDRMNKSLERLSSGFRINKAADDAAGLSIANNLRAQLVGLKTASRNVSQASSLVQTAEGAINEISNMLVRLRELAVSSASDNNDANARAALDTERSALINEIDRLVNATEFNNQTLLDGTFGASLAPGSYSAAIDTEQERIDAGITNIVVDATKVAANSTFTIVDTGNADTLLAVAADIGDGAGVRTVTMTADVSSLGLGETLELNYSDIGLKLTLNASYTDGGTLDSATFQAVSSGSAASFQVGADSTTGNTITLSLGNFATTGTILNNINAGSISTQSAASTFIGTVDTAITNINSELGTLGSLQNRFSFASANLASAVENTASAESVIRDADLAAETTEYTKSQILVQAGVSILAQANSAQQVVLALLQ